MGDPEELITETKLWFQKNLGISFSLHYTLQQPDFHFCNLFLFSAYVYMSVQVRAGALRGQLVTDICELLDMGSGNSSSLEEGQAL